MHVERKGGYLTVISVGFVFFLFSFVVFQRCRLASTAPANRSRKWEREGSLIAFLAVHGGLPPHTIHLGTSYGVLRSAYCRLGGYHLWY